MDADVVGCTVCPHARAREFAGVRAQLDQAQARIDELEGDTQRLAEDLNRAQKRLEGARRAGKRQAAPFSRDAKKADPKRPGRKAGQDYGPRARLQVPAPDEIDEIIWHQRMRRLFTALLRPSAQHPLDEHPAPPTGLTRLPATKLQPVMPTRRTRLRPRNPNTALSRQPGLNRDLEDEYDLHRRAFRPRPPDAAHVAGVTSFNDTPSIAPHQPTGNST